MDIQTNVYLPWLIHKSVVTKLLLPHNIGLLHIYRDKSSYIQNITTLLKKSALYSFPIGIAFCNSFNKILSLTNDLAHLQLTKYESCTLQKQYMPAARNFECNSPRDLVYFESIGLFGFIGCHCE